MPDANTTYDFETARDLLDALMPWSSLNPKINLKDYVFRGQRDADHELIPSALRPLSKSEMIRKMNVFVETHPDQEHSPFIQAFVSIS